MTTTKTPDQLRQDLATQVEKIRALPEITDRAKQQRIAKVYRDASSQMVGLEKSDREARTATLTKAAGTAFGVAHLAGSPDAKLAVVASHSAALDKVAAIDNPKDAADLLQRSDQFGDEVLARAVAHHADAMSQRSLADPAWMDVLNSYAVPRPDAFKAIETLHAARKEGPLSNAFEYILVAPSEVGNATGHQLDLLADSGDPAVAASIGTA